MPCKKRAAAVPSTVIVTSSELAAAFTVAVTVPALALTDAFGGVTVYVHAIAACDTVTV